MSASNSLIACFGFSLFMSIVWVNLQKAWMAFSFDWKWFAVKFPVFVILIPRQVNSCTISRFLLSIWKVFWIDFFIFFLLTINILDFLPFIVSCHVLQKEVTALIQFCSSSLHFDNKTKSSAYNKDDSFVLFSKRNGSVRLVLSTILGKSLRYKLNNNGLKIDPYLTPFRYGNVLVRLDPNFMKHLDMSTYL